MIPVDQKTSSSNSSSDLDWDSSIKGSVPHSCPGKKTLGRNAGACPLHQRPSPLKDRTSSRMRTITIGGTPEISRERSVNFVTITIRNVMAVAIAPVPLTTALRRAFRSFDFDQCITIPAWDKVNARKAPMAKRGISLSVTPLKQISRLPARTVNTTMPCVQRVVDH